MSKSPRFEIDYETSDRITVLNLKDTMNYLIKENKQYENKPDLLPHQKEDYAYNLVTISALKAVLRHYGERVE